MSESVWFKTQRRNGAGGFDDIGIVTGLKRKNNEIVSWFLGRVKVRKSPLVDYCPAEQLEVRVLDGQGNERVLRASEKIPSDCGLDEDHPLILTLKSTLSSTKNKKKKPANLVLDPATNADLSRALSMNVVQSSPVWATAATNNDRLYWSSEASIRNYVHLILRELLHSIGRADVICEAELTVMHFRPDVWILFANRAPIGVVEVKKPVRSVAIAGDVMCADVVHGQILDYLLMLHNYFGIARPFGIVSTYEAWRPYWLAENHDGLRREVCGGDVIRPFDAGVASTTFPTIVCNVLLKMLEAGTQRSAARLQSRFVVYDADSYSWESFQNFGALRYGFELPDGVERLFVLESLGMGLHGRALKVASKDGVVGVIKFFNVSRELSATQTEESLLQAELEVWRAVYGDMVPGVRMQTFVGRPALLMPFVDVAAAVSRQDAEQAARRIADRGYQHDDFRRRHIGFFNTSVVAFDFGDVTPLVAADPSARENAVRLMMETFDAESGGVVLEAVADAGDGGVAVQAAADATDDGGGNKRRRRQAHGNH